MSRPLSTCSRMKMSCIYPPPCGKDRPAEGRSGRGAWIRTTTPPPPSLTLRHKGEGNAPAIGERNVIPTASRHVARPPWRRDALKILARSRHGAKGLVDVPLILHVGGLLGADRI